MKNEGIQGVSREKAIDKPLDVPGLAVHSFFFFSRVQSNLRIRADKQINMNTREQCFLLERITSRLANRFAFQTARNKHTTIDPGQLGCVNTTTRRVVETISFQN